MFRRKKNTENTPQIGPDAEQLSEPTPVGDAIEDAIRHQFSADSLAAEADEIGSSGVADGLIRSERLYRVAAAKADLAKLANELARNNLKGFDKAYWKKAAQSPLPRRR